MTEIILRQEQIEFKLNCKLNTDIIHDRVEYYFKMEQREKGKRKWKHIKEESHSYYAYTKMENILKYISKEQVIELAELEYKKYEPIKLLFNE